MRWRAVALAIGIGAGAASGATAATFGSIQADLGTAGGGHDFGAGGSVLYALSNPGLQMQFDLGYDNVSGSGGSGSAFHAGGDLFWRDAKGTIGASFTYIKLGSSFYSNHLTSYGAFAEWYVNRAITLRVRAAEFSGFGGGRNGFAQAGLVYYPANWLALSAQAGYTGIAGNKGGGFGLGAEYMFSGLPLSLALNFDADTGGGGSSDTVAFVIRYRFGDPGARHLEAFQRRGTIDWGSGFPTAVPL